MRSIFRSSFFLSLNTVIKLLHLGLKDDNIMVQDEKMSLNKQLKNFLHSKLQGWKVLKNYVQANNYVKHAAQWNVC